MSGFRSAVRLSGHLVVTSRKHLLAFGRLICPNARILRRHGRLCGEPLLSAQHRPGDSGKLVGEGDNRNIAMGASQQRFCPSAERRVALSDIGQRRARPVDQLSAKVFVAALADPEQLRFAAGGELPWNQPEPGGEITTALKALRSPDRGDKRRCDERADPGDGRQSAGVFILFRESDKFGVEGRDPPIELKPIARERLRRARSSAGSIPLLPVRPSARPGTARASACPARPPIRAPAEWRAAD